MISSSIHLLGAKPGTPLYLSSLSVLNITCTQNSFKSESHQVQYRSFVLSTSLACNLNPHVSYGSAATNIYWKFLSGGSSTFCSNALMNRTFGSTSCEISGYCNWNSKPCCLVTGSRVFVILYPGRPILTTFFRTLTCAPTMPIGKPVTGSTPARPSFCSRAARRARFV